MTSQRPRVARFHGAKRVAERPTALGRMTIDVTEPAPGVYTLEVRFGGGGRGPATIHSGPRPGDPTRPPRDEE
jgi:hypothetical protein